MSCCILIRVTCRLEKREDESAISDGLVIRRSMRWYDLWGLSAKKLSQRETHCSRVAQRNRRVRGRLIMREKNWCKRVERH